MQPQAFIPAQPISTAHYATLFNAIISVQPNSGAVALQAIIRHAQYVPGAHLTMPAATQGHNVIAMYCMADGTGPSLCVFTQCPKGQIYRSYLLHSRYAVQDHRGNPSNPVPAAWLKATSRSLNRLAEQWYCHAHIYGNNKNGGGNYSYSPYHWYYMHPALAQYLTQYVPYMYGNAPHPGNPPVFSLTY